MKNNEKPMPYLALLAFAMTGFICIMTETIPAGLLPEISHDMAIPMSTAGQLVTAYALGSLFSAIPLTIATRSWSRRNVLLATVLGFILFNSLTAISTDLVLVFTARFLAGSSAGLAWSLLAGYARRIVEPHQQGKAMAIAMVGTPIALSAGVPFGTWLGQVLGWRLTFGTMSALSGLLIIWIVLCVPNVPGQSKQVKLQFGKVLNMQGVKPVLAVVLTWMLAHNILYTYIAPFVQPSGLYSNVEFILMVFGLASLVGIFITGKLIDKHLRITVLVSLFAFFVISLMFGLFITNSNVIVIGTAIWGLTFGGAATLLNTALADAAGEWADIAISLTVVSWNSAISLGGIVGGVLLQIYGISSLPFMLVALLFVSLLIVKNNSNYAFPRSR
ncbi:MFS transporter [Pokkaliibacter plantistimulans]|uniref:MFS transporter n=1 Tax=Proteobacteria bacterium 228 TaxID=2083153 RepID=A0A2S5KTK0_9PROT|nr:MFS transporter [Pokkaliibacter plantistimulans]PPC77596.1 MFS transporter [Pokkaliibacter plantistimulans]